MVVKDGRVLIVVEKWVKDIISGDHWEEQEISIDLDELREVIEAASCDKYATYNIETHETPVL